MARKWCPLDGRFTETDAILDLGDRYGAAGISIPVVLLNLATQEEWAGGREPGEFRALITRIADQARSDTQTVRDVISTLVDPPDEAEWEPLLAVARNHKTAPVLCWVNWLEWAADAQRQLWAERKRQERAKRAQAQ